jgi:hypothetical protein
MEAMSPTVCPHGLDPATCEICRVLRPTPVPAGRSIPRRAGRSGPPGVATVVVVAIVGFLVLGWVAAAVFAVLRILELVAIAAVAGSVGFRLGVRRGRRGG